MYAEILGSEADKFKKIVQESKIYKFSKFLVCPSKPAYKPFPNRYMIKMTPWTKVAKVKQNDNDFPSYVFNLTPFSDLSSHVGMQEYFTDVMGLIVAVSKVAYIRMASNSSDTPKRNCEIKFVLRGQRALDFDADSVYELGQSHAVVGIFVGKPITVKKLLVEDQLVDGILTRIYQRSTNSLIGVEAFGSSRRQARAEQKTAAELKNIDPWETQASSYLCTVIIAKVSPSQPRWFLSCSCCHRTGSPYSSTYKCSGGCSSVAAIPN